MAVLLYRIGAFSARRHFVMIGIWLLIVVAAVVGSKVFAGVESQSVEIPNTQSQTAIDMLNSRFPAANGAGSKVIYVAPQGQSIRSFETQISAAAAQLKTLPNVAAVTDPFDTSGSAAANAAAALQIAPDASMAYVSVTYSVPATELTQADAEAIQHDGNEAATGGLTVAYAGVAPAEGADNSQEAIGVLVALVILAITIGSLLAAGMPLITALAGVVITGSSITIIADFVTISATAPILSSMLGLAVGIDYSLFIVSRHRSQLVAGIPPRESIAIAASTAGSAVVFAGITVIIALIGLSVVGIPFLSVMGISAACGVVLAMAVSLTFLPALLGLLNTKLIPKPESRAARREHELANPEHGTKPTLGRRWVTLVTAKPLVTVILIPVALVIVALPAFGIKLTVPDAGYDAPGSQARVAYDTFEKGYGAGFNGPLLITADISRVQAADLQKAFDALAAEFTGIPDVAAVSAVIPNQALDMAIVSVTPSSAPDSDETKALVQTLRDDAASFEAAHGFTFMVTGQTAVAIDISNVLGAALLPFALVVVGLCLVLLMIVFRSLAVPITATLGFLLSVGASLGIVALVFNEGYLADVLGVQKVGPVISFMPILVIAVLFGLAMDYQVFLVSRMREDYSRTGRAKEAVADGFSAAARVVTAAALIMFSVFASFFPGASAAVQPLAGALAIGVLIDAFLVRMTLIPAIMTMLGTSAWYLPAWLGRLLPNVDVEGEQVHELIAARDWRPAAAAAAGAAAGAIGTSVAGSTPDAAATASVQDAADRPLAPDAAGPRSTTRTAAAPPSATAAPQASAGAGADPEGPAPVTRAAVGAEKRALAKARAAEAKRDRRAARAAQLAPAAVIPPLTAAVAAGGLGLPGLAPFDLDVEPGALVLVREPAGADSALAPDTAGAAVLAAVTARLPRFDGHLSVFGHPQPFERSAVRHRSRLVLGAGAAAGASADAADSTLTVGEYLLGEVRLDAPRARRHIQLDAVARHLRSLEAVVATHAAATVPPTAPAGDTPSNAAAGDGAAATTAASTPLAALGVPARWCIDVALALASSAELIAVDARYLAPALATELVRAVAVEARPDVTLVFAMPAAAASGPPLSRRSASRAPATARPVTELQLQPAAATGATGGATPTGATTGTSTAAPTAATGNPATSSEQEALV